MKWFLEDLNTAGKFKIETRSNGLIRVPKELDNENAAWLEIVDNLETIQQPVWVVDVNDELVLDVDGNAIQSTDANEDLIFEDIVINRGKILVVNETTKASIQAQDALDVTQKVREGKLDSIRAIREPLMKDVDIMVNELALGDRLDTAAIKQYRDALKALTDPHKDVNGDVTSNIDTLADDLSDLVLPIKP